MRGIRTPLVALTFDFHWSVVILRLRDQGFGDGEESELVDIGGGGGETTHDCVNRAGWHVGI